VIFFGEPNRVSAVDNRFMFTGREYDSETGLYYYRARYYSLKLGRFLQTDPIRYRGGLNLYTYCGNNPLHWVDPLGLCKEDGYDYWSALEDIGLGQALIDGVYLTGYGVSFGLSGDDQHIAELETRYGDFATASELLGETSTVLTGTAGVTSCLGLNVAICGGAAVANNPKVVGDVSVYHSIQNGVVNYVGMTNDLARRAGEQARALGIRIDPIPGLSNLSRADARAVEQVLIERYGLGSQGGTLLNKINSIATSNPIYPDAVRRGNEILQAVR